MTEKSLMHFSKISKVILLIGSGFVFSGCGKMATNLGLNNKFTTDNGLNGGLALPSSSEFKNAQLVLQKCTTCHGPGQSMASKSLVFATEDEAFASPWFKRGDIKSQGLLRTIGSGSATANMPPTGDWSAEEYEALKRWVVGSAAVTPTPTPEEFWEAGASIKSFNLSAAQTGSFEVSFNLKPSSSSIDGFAGISTATPSVATDVAVIV